MGLQLKKEIVFGCLANTLDRSVISWNAHSATLGYLCKKWFGSHEEMFDFARSVSAQVPEGSGLHALIPEAHHERWLFAAAFDKDYEFAEKYFDQREVQLEIVDAYRRSLGSPFHKVTRATRYQSSFFALSLIRCQAFKEALFEFERLGELIPKYPWAQLGDPVERFTRAKDSAKRNLS